MGVLRNEAIVNLVFLSACLKDSKILQGLSRWVRYYNQER
jgi:hypothetical protein